mmetsp:Transcript_113093/g.359344  ORF Transcript_113093/g.359344 Transcript_113093/m.359344 type:complete len:284 (-) Transcript_113093:2614-3465(-)
MAQLRGRGLFAHLGLCLRGADTQTFRDLDNKVLGTILHPMVTVKLQNEHHVAIHLLRRQDDSHLLHTLVIRRREEVLSAREQPLLAIVTRTVVKREVRIRVSNELGAATGLVNSDASCQAHTENVPRGRALERVGDFGCCGLQGSIEGLRRLRQAHHEVVSPVVDPLIRRAMKHKLDGNWHVCCSKRHEDCSGTLLVGSREPGLYGPGDGLAGRSAAGEDLAGRVLPEAAEGLDGSPVEDQILAHEAVHDHLQGRGLHTIDSSCACVSQHLHAPAPTQVCLED